MSSETTKQFFENLRLHVASHSFHVQFEEFERLEKQAKEAKVEGAKT